LFDARRIAATERCFAFIFALMPCRYARRHAAIFMLMPLPDYAASH
jgi:hypothetical protein